MTTWTDETEQDRYRHLCTALDAEQRAQERGRHRLPCPDCGCPEGLRGWSRDAIAEAKSPLPREFYIAEGYDPDKLYTLCQSCHKATGEVLSRCRLLDAAEIAEWVLGEFTAKELCSLAEQIERGWAVVPDVWDDPKLWRGL